MEISNTKITSQNKELMESKIKIEHLENWIKKSKIILKQYEKETNVFNVNKIKE